MSSDKSKGGVVDRLPRNYYTILEAIQDVSAGQHPTAQDVHVRARAAQPKIGFATVHRGLARLAELGYVLKVDIPGAASAVYERAASPHAHFHCLSCGSIQDVEYSVSQEVLVTLAEQHGFQIAAESTTFAGCCAKCTTKR